MIFRFRGDVAERAAARAYEHIRQLSVVIGPRPSAGEGERRAALYAARVLRRAGVGRVRLEPFVSPRSTYAPYRAAFTAALLGLAARRILPGRVGAGIAAGLSGMAGQAFFAEADLAPSWAQRLGPRGGSQNVVGVIPAHGRPRQRVVIYGHLDSHRTPVFYSSALWLRLFSPLLGAAFASMGLNTLRFTAELLAPRTGQKRWPRALAAALDILSGGLQLFGLAMTVQADTTPFAPGANDNASGAATALALAERLARQPLRHTEVWVVATGCEEVGSHGMAALLERHAEPLRDALFIGFDMVGIGKPAVIPEQGLLRRRRADARLLRAARAVARAHPELQAWEHPIDAFDDSYMVARRGFRGITIDAEGQPGSHAAPEHKHWHRPTDTIDKLDRGSLARVHSMAWYLLQHLDKS